MAQLLSDNDIRARLSADDAVDWMREAVCCTTSAA